MVLHGKLCFAHMQAQEPVRGVPSPFNMGKVSTKSGLAKIALSEAAQHGLTT